MFDKDTSTWVERGRGQVRLNDLRTQAESGTSVTSRIIMRTAGSLRVILNSKIFPEMTLEKPTEKNIRLTAMDGLVSFQVFKIIISPVNYFLCLLKGLKRVGVFQTIFDIPTCIYCLPSLYVTQKWTLLPNKRVQILFDKFFTPPRVFT